MSERKSGKRQRRSYLKKETQEKMVKSRVEFNEMIDRNVHCFRLICDELPLQEVVKLRAVCSKWKEAITTEICAPKTSINLIILTKNKVPYYYHEWELQLLNHGENPIKTRNELKIFNINKNPGVHSFLAQLFPSIQHLSILKDQFVAEDNELISNWSHQIVSLVLLFRDMSSKYLTRYGSCERMFSMTLNKLIYLRKLNIFTRHFSRQQYLRLAPTFARLESVAIHIPYPELLTLGILNLLGPDLHRLGMLASDEDYTSQFVSALKLDQANQLSLVKNLTHLTLLRFGDSRLLKFIFRNFINLKYLAIQAWLSDDGSKLSTLLPAELVNAKNLEELTLLNVDLRFDYGPNGAPKNIATLKRLTLELSYHYEIKAFPKGWCWRLAEMFPKLEQLEISMHLWWLHDPKFKEELVNNRGLFKHLKSLKTK